MAENDGAGGAGGGQGEDSEESIVAELNIKDYDPANPKEKTYLGIITKLRANNRKTKGEFEKLKTDHESVLGEVTNYRRSSKETSIMNSVLGDDKVIGDQAKFEKYKAKILANAGDKWEDELKELAADFAVPKKKEDPPEEEEAAKKKAADEAAAKKTEEDEAARKKEEEEKKPPYKPSWHRGKGREVPGTEVRAPKSISEKIKLSVDDPDAYETFRAKRGRKG